jgi:hypothetical protein
MTSKYRLPYAIVSFAVVIALSAMIALPGCTPAPEKKPAEKPAAKPAAVEKTKKTAAEKASVEKPAEKSAEKAAAKPAEKSAEKAVVDAAGMPAPPKVSAFAPAADLAKQADWYVGELEKSTADEAAYKESVEVDPVTQKASNTKVNKEANTLVVIALALGLNDQDSKFKANAGAVMKAAQELAATKDLPSAKKAVAALKDAVEGKAKADAVLKWEKVASLPELMKQVPIINTKLKRNIKGDKFKSKAKDTEGYTAVLAAIAQGAMADTSQTKNPEQVKQWYDWSAKARDYAGAVNAAIRAGNESAAAEAMKKMAQNCDDCHAVFHPGAEPTEAAEATK